MEHAGSFWIYFYQIHINMTNDRVFDLSELTEVSIIKTLVKGEKLMTDRYKKILT